MSQEDQYLKQPWLPNGPPHVTDSVPHQRLAEAIIGVTEAISRCPRNDRKFALYHIDNYMSHGTNPVEILRKKQDLLIPWTRAVQEKKSKSKDAGSGDTSKKSKSHDEYLLVHARFTEEGGKESPPRKSKNQRDNSASKSSGSRVKITYYSFLERIPGAIQKRTTQDPVVEFLRLGDWFDSDQVPEIEHSWVGRKTTGKRDQCFMVVYIATALALGLEPKIKSPPRWNDDGRDLANAVLEHLASGRGTPQRALAMLRWLDLVDIPWTDRWGSDLFDNTVDVITDFASVWTYALQSQNASPLLQQLACFDCDVANHCQGPNAQGQQCSACPVQGHCCDQCPVLSHCIPDILPNATRGELYNWSIHKFRPGLGHVWPPMKFPSNTDVDRWFSVTCKDHLAEQDVLRAIVAVTEAISLNDRGKQFSLYSQSHLDHGRVDMRSGQPSQSNPYYFEIVRPMSELVLPVVINLDLLKVKAGIHVDFSNGVNPDKGHIILAHIKLDASASNFSVDIWDSSLSFLRKVKQETEDFIQDFLKRTGWWNNGNLPPGAWTWIGDDDGGNNGSTKSKISGPTLPVQQNDSGPVCGIHTILNGWALALGFTLNPSPKLRLLHRAVEVITHACYGKVDCETICQFLHFIAWIQPGSQPAHDRIFTETCDFSRIDKLDTHVHNRWAAEKAPQTLASLSVKAFGAGRTCVNCKNPQHCSVAGSGAQLSMHHRMDPGSKRRRRRGEQEMRWSKRRRTLT